MPVCKWNKAGKFVLESIEKPAISISTEFMKPSSTESAEPSTTKSSSTESVEPSSTTESAKLSSTESAKSSTTEFTKSSIAQQKLYSQRLTQKDEILLFQLYIQHSLSFQMIKNHKHFWMKISGLFEKTAKHPYSWQSCKQKIEDFTIKWKIILKAEETGTTQISENPLDQVIDEWIEIWDAAKEKKKSQKLSKSQQEERASMSTKYCEDLLQVMSQKQSRDSELEDENEKKVIDVDKEFTASPESSSHPPIHLKKRHRKPWADDEISKKMMNTLQKVGDALIMKTETSQTDDQIESLMKEMKKMKKNLDKQQNQLALILSLLQKEKKKE